MSFWILRDHETRGRVRRQDPARWLLLAGERDQRTEVPVVVGRLQRRDVATAQPARLGKRGAAPAEPGAAERHDKRVGDEPRPPPVAVREGVDDNEPVAEPDRALVAAVTSLGGVGEPGAHITKDVAHVHAYLPERY